MPEIKETTIELKDVLSIFRRRKWLILLPLILVTLISFGGSFLLEERYQSSTMVVIDQTQILSKELQAMVPGQYEGRRSDAQRRSRLIAIHNEIVSSSYLSRLIDELGLYEDQEAILEAQKLHVKRPDLPVKNLVYHILINQLREDIDINFNGENIIQLTAESEDPIEAMSIATKLGEIFKDERLKRELKDVRGALDFTDEQLAIYKKNLEEAETRKVEFTSTFIRNRLDESVSADANIRTIMADIDDIKLRIDKNIKDQTKLRTELVSYPESSLKLELDNRYTQAKRNAYAETERLAEYMSKYTWSDPKVIDAQQTIASEMRQIERLVSGYVEEQFPDASTEDKETLTQYFMLQAHESVQRRKLTNFDVALSILRGRIAKSPEYAIQMRTLEIEVSSAREIYEKFKSQLTGSEISQSLMRGSSETKYRIMEPASVPLEPVKPNRLKITMLGLILGLFIGGAAALLAELLDNSFKKVEDVEEFLEVPVLATIPNIPSIKKMIKVG